MSAMHMSDPKNPKGNETLSTETVIPWIRKDLGDQVTLFVLKSEDLLEVLENADAKATGTWEVRLLQLFLLSLVLGQTVDLDMLCQHGNRTSTDSHISLLYHEGRVPCTVHARVLIRLIRCYDCLPCLCL